MRKPPHNFRFHLSDAEFTFFFDEDHQNWSYNNNMTGLLSSCKGLSFRRRCDLQIRCRSPKTGNMTARILIIMQKCERSLLSYSLIEKANVPFLTRTVWGSDKHPSLHTLPDVSCQSKTFIRFTKRLHEYCRTQRVGDKCTCLTNTSYPLFFLVSSLSALILNVHTHALTHTHYAHTIHTHTPQYAHKHTTHTHTTYTLSHHNMHTNTSHTTYTTHTLTHHSTHTNTPHTHARTHTHNTHKRVHTFLSWQKCTLSV